MTNSTVPQLTEEYEYQKTLFENQPVIVQRFLEGQAQSIAEALISKISRARFTLPDRVMAQIAQVKQNGMITIPESERQIQVGGLLRSEVREALILRLNELERSADQAIAVSAGLLRYATAAHMVHNLLPAGRTVIYRPDGDEPIPTIPVEDNAPESAITAVSDAIVEEGREADRGDLQTPFVPAARKFFLPQWVAFDGQGNLLVGTVKEAEAHIQSMQRYVMILHRAISLSPYMSACEEYQRKRYGILGQLVNQGRALAIFQAKEIIDRIKKRAEAGSLNRGLRLHLPYFDDQDLKVEISSFEVIPSGRIMFVPAFVVRAVRQEQVKVSQDTRFNSSTRKHLLYLLGLIEQAFQFTNQKA